MEKLETNDIQGIIVRGYSELPAAAFLLIGIKEREAAKRWIKKIAPEITTGIEKPTNNAINIAFTLEGLKILGLNETALDSFPMELQDGMITKHKQQFLGDYGTSAPAHWEWGGKDKAPVHLLLMLH